MSVLAVTAQRMAILWRPLETARAPLNRIHRNIFTGLRIFHFRTLLSGRGKSHLHFTNQSEKSHDARTFRLCSRLPLRPALRNTYRRVLLSSLPSEHHTGMGLGSTGTARNCSGTVHSRGCGMIRVPTELVDYKQWVLWRRVDANGRMTKIPISPWSGKAAACDRPVNLEYVSTCVLRASPASMRRNRLRLHRRRSFPRN